MYPYPNNFKFLDFILFNGHKIIIAIEYIARFTCQCKKASDSDFFKLKIIPKFVSQECFYLYINLPPNSVQNWNDMQIIFQTHFSRTRPEFVIDDLVKLKQYPGETIKQYLDRFMEIREQCQVKIPEKCIYYNCSSRIRVGTKKDV